MWCRHMITVHDDTAKVRRGYPEEGKKGGRTGPPKVVLRSLLTGDDKRLELGHIGHTHQTTKMRWHGSGRAVLPALYRNHAAASCRPRRERWNRSGHVNPQRRGMPEDLGPQPASENGAPASKQRSCLLKGLQHGLSLSSLASTHHTGAGPTVGHTMFGGGATQQERMLPAFPPAPAQNGTHSVSPLPM